MKIHYIGLSAFLIENRAGFRILVDPFTDEPVWTLGPKFPKTFEGKPFGANIVLMTEPDLDHSATSGSWMASAPQTKPNSNPFPDLNVKGTIIYEWNGDVNIAWNYTVDGVRLAHFGDNAHVLTTEQIQEIGAVDIIFMSPQKVFSEENLNVTRKNIELLKPKVVFWSHHIAPKGIPESSDPSILRPFFVEYFKKNASTNSNYKGEKSFMELCTLLETAYKLNPEYHGEILKESSVEITEESLPRSTKSYLFLSQLGE